MYNGRETTSIRRNKVKKEGIRPSACSELLNVTVGGERCKNDSEKARWGVSWSNTECWKDDRRCLGIC